MPNPKNPVRFRAQLDQLDAQISKKLSVADTEMLAATYIQIYRPIKYSKSTKGAMKFIEKCGPAMVDIAVMSLLRMMANEMCRRGEIEQEESDASP